MNDAIKCPLGCDCRAEAKPKPLSVLIAEHEAAAAALKVASQASDDARKAEQAAAKAVCAAIDQAGDQWARVLLMRGGKILLVCRTHNREYSYAAEPIAFAD